MRVLITGADGFAGHHLIRELGSDSELHGTTFRPMATPIPNVSYHVVDLRDEQAVADLIGTLRPEQIYHLAAQSSPAQSYKTPWETLENNIRIQLNVILACLKHGLKPRLLVISSGDVYGDQLVTPATEDSPFRPTNPYSVSKVTQDMLALQYHLSNDLPILRARPFNHLGPGQSKGFVAPDFALQIAQIEVGEQEPIMHVGSLSAERDFTDVRDVMRAYHLIMERGTPGSVYNIATGTARTIHSLLTTLLSLSTATITIEADSTRLRPGSVSQSWGDASRLRAETGWQPTISLEQTLSDVLDDCRQRILIKESK